MPRFVILEHDHPFLHWDFMLESHGGLQTWRLATRPDEFPLHAEPLPDHRIQYLDFEGPIKNRGSVFRWDQGIFEEVSENSNGRTISLEGEKILAKVTMKKKSGNEWEFSWEPHHQ